MSTTAAIAEDQLLKLKEGAAQTRVSTWTFRGWLKSGRLPSYRVGKQLMVKRSDLDRFIADSRA